MQLSKRWMRGNTCSPFTCKSCKCFKREQESQEEDLDLSNQYESDEDESELDDSWESSENEGYARFAELDDSFTE